MFSKDIQPSEALRNYIKLIRLRHFIVNPTARLSFKPFPPRPEQCLIFYPRGFEIIENVVSGQKTARTGSVVSGQFTQRINRYLGSSEFLMIEVNFQPGALHRLTGVPFKELRDIDVDAEVLFSSEIPRVNERLRSSDSYQEMINIIEGFFMNLVKKEKKLPQHVDRMITLTASGFEVHSVDIFAKNSYLSSRQLGRIFDERVGVGPKTFMRLCRFNRSYWMRLAEPSADWLSIALACGYNDYQHLVKDYREFANTTPNQFFIEESKAPGRVLGLTR